MISQLKIQLNLYSHREKDNSIIENLGLNNVQNSNNKVREILYNISCNKTIQTSNDDLDKLIKEIEFLKTENQKLEIENNLLKSISVSSKVSTIEVSERKINNKLLASVKTMEL